MADQQPAKEAGDLPKVFGYHTRTQKLTLFASYLAEGQTPPQAYVSAGYEGKSGDMASRLTRNPTVQRLFKRFMIAKRTASPAKDIDWLNRNLLKMAGVDAHGKVWGARYCIDPKTNLPKPLAQWPRACKGLIKGFKYRKRTTTTKAGDVLVDEETEFVLHNPSVILRDMKAPIEKLVQLGAAEAAARKAQGSAEESARELVTAMEQMRATNGVSEPVPAADMALRPH